MSKYIGLVSIISPGDRGDEWRVVFGDTLNEAKDWINRLLDVHHPHIIASVKLWETGQEIELEKEKYNLEIPRLRVK